MSAEEYLKQFRPEPNITNDILIGIKNEETYYISQIMESYAREYHAKEMERKLGTVHGSHIEEAGFYSMRNQANSYDKRYGFIKGAKWLLNHLKEDKG